MIKTIEFITLLLIAWIVTWFICEDKKADCNFMDYLYTDVLRGIGAMLVVISHVSGLTGTRVATPLGGIGVALFLVCSGYGMQKSYDKKGLKGFWKSKINRILIPYWIAVVLYYAINIQIPRDVYIVIKCILLIHPIPYMWYIKYLIIVNILFYLIYMFFKTKYRNGVTLGLCILGLVLFRNDMYAEQSFSFFTGILLAQNRDYVLGKINKNKSLLIGIICLLVGIFFLAVKQMPMVRTAPYYIMNIVQLLIKWMCALGIVFGLWKLWPKKNGGIIQVGKRSYEVYIIHTMFIPLLDAHSVTLFWMVIYVLVCILWTAWLQAVLNKVKSFNTLLRW